MWLRLTELNVSMFRHSQHEFDALLQVCYPEDSVLGLD
jgi:hypothetical protein